MLVFTVPSRHRLFSIYFLSVFLEYYYHLYSSSNLIFNIITMKEEKRERRGERKELTGLTALTGVRRNSEAEPSRPDSLKDESRKAASEPSVLSVVAASGAWRPRLRPHSGYRLPRGARPPPRGSLDRLTLRSSSAAAVEPPPPGRHLQEPFASSGAARDGAAVLTV